MALKGEYDAVIIGAGHNGLILAGYLARAGLEVIVLERYLEQGGGLDTHVDPRFPGFLHNMHSFFHRNLTNLSWWRDLKVGEYDVEYLRPEVGCGMLMERGRCILLYADIEKTKKSIRKISAADAKMWEEVHRRWQPVVRDVTEPMTYSPPIGWDKLKSLLNGSGPGREFLQFADKSCDEVVCDLFESDAVRAFLLYLSDIRGYDTWSKRLGWLIPHMVATGVNPQMARGTSHRLAHALDASALSAGADVVEGKEVTRILVENGRAKGVELRSGERLLARRLIATSTGPGQTFGDLIEPGHVDRRFAEKTKKYEYGPIGPIFSINLALNERPVYTAEKHEPDAGRSLLTVVGLDSKEDMDELHHAHNEGRLPKKLFFNGTTPTVFDPSQAPAGKHTAFMWQLVPYRLADGGPRKWLEIQDEFLDALHERWARFAPNLKKAGVIVSKFCQTPVDIENHFNTMVGGDWMEGHLYEEQFYDRRPLPELSGYRTPIEGLYLCGSCCHPGGNITGGPGYNAAKAVAEDLGMDPWWKPLNFEEHLSALK
ncbi:MAG: phytoene desaturase family protein [Nitrospinota bacterium]